MKRNLLFIATAIISMALNACNINIDGESLGSETIKGNGNLVSRTFDVNAFDDMSVLLPTTVNFTVADEYTCSVRVDENIMEYLDIKVDGRELILQKQAKHKNVNLRASSFVIDITGPGLADINLAGSGTINVLSPMEREQMEVNVAGSGDIVFDQAVNVEIIKMNVAGSGDLVLNDLAADKLIANVAGSGDMKVARGTIREAEASVAGSGDIVLTCDIENLNADIAGSGDIKARVSGTLKYGIIGSGDIGYYGNPVVNGEKVGSGQVHRLSE
ncbi:MAG: DUF2807 domain-containing protein [Bacteroidales bacterium]|nr:DUF2807 domain-containing protein [Bacteroidales bacterium]